MRNNPAYSKNKEEIRLFNQLRKRVKERIASIPEDRDRYIRIKAIILPLVYFGSYFIALFNTNHTWLYIGLFVLMGFTLVLIYLNLIHEAAHNNIYKNKKYNRWILGLFDLIGAN